jgi:hypothetical protein
MSKVASCNIIGDDRQALRLRICDGILRSDDATNPPFPMPTNAVKKTANRPMRRLFIFSATPGSHMQAAVGLEESAASFSDKSLLMSGLAQIVLRGNAGAKNRLHINRK